ncbi:hypothetical protein A5642_28140 [Mycolicibacterium mucogenicum]|uniref:Uncharacterized protein n=1 Tax=Mycolicibacterium mucogenicum TaxID=56689 RepID=A0A1A0MA53_MYCMU|nr:hypothetical protein A5642_28140 [Mycolicibacterium mucogenicum]
MLCDEPAHGMGNDHNFCSHLRVFGTILAGSGMLVPPFDVLFDVSRQECAVVCNRKSPVIREGRDRVGVHRIASKPLNERVVGIHFAKPWQECRPAEEIRRGDPPVLAVALTLRQSE